MKVALVCLLAACTYPEKEFTPPFACLGAPPPTTAETPVSIEGTVVDASDSEQRLPGVSISLVDRNLNPISGPLTTDASGAFSFSLNTAGAPIDRVYLNAAASGRVTTFVAPERPITQDLLAIRYGLTTTMQRDSLALGALGMPFTANTAAVLMTITDCNNKPLAHASLTSVPAGAIRYFDGVMPSMTATQTDAAGVAMVANLPPGMVTLTATVDGMQFPARSFLVAADSFLQTIIVP